MPNGTASGHDKTLSGMLFRPLSQILAAKTVGVSFGLWNGVAALTAGRVTCSAMSTTWA